MGTGCLAWVLWVLATGGTEYGVITCVSGLQLFADANANVNPFPVINYFFFSNADIAV